MRGIFMDKRKHHKDERTRNEHEEHLARKANLENSAESQPELWDDLTEDESERTEKYAGPHGLAGSETSTDDANAIDAVPDREEPESPESPSDLYTKTADMDDLRVVGPEEAGTAEGLDEAELGRVKPLDKKPWDGDPTEPTSR
jgi:hypothetical protein